MVTLLRPADPEYPRLLRALARPPDLHVRGDIVPDDALAVAIVGSRRATAYGIEAAERLAADLATRGVTVVSGLARGIDTAAHRGAFEAGGRTIAVLGSGIDVMYPPENAALARKIVARGALVSQFPLGTRPDPWNFPQRNHVIAGLSLGVIVVEAAEQSGALITAGLAGDLGREVFAVPGRITSDVSRGTNRLIQDGAKLVQDWPDVVQELPDEWRRLVRGAAAIADRYKPDERGDDGLVLALLTPDEPRHIEELIERSGLPASRVGRSLVALQIGGRVRELGGQRWVSLTPRPRRPDGEGLGS